jgi:hypothetical protein
VFPDIETTSFGNFFEMLQRMEEVLMPLYDNKEVTRVLLRLPASFSSTNEVNSVRGIVVLGHWSERNRFMQEIVQDVNRKLAALPGYRAFSVARRGLGGGTGKPVEFVLGGSDYDELAHMSKFTGFGVRLVITKCRSRGRGLQRPPNFATLTLIQGVSDLRVAVTSGERPARAQASPAS